MLFFIYQAFKRIIVFFLSNVQFNAFSLDYFFNSKFFLICFLQFFFVECTNNFLSIKIINDICPCLFFHFCNVKNLFRPIWSVTFCKNVFLCFFILTISPILNLGSLSLISLIQRIYVFDFTSTGLILIVL